MNSKNCLGKLRYLSENRPFAATGPVCEEYGVWLHCDGAYGGNSFICPELRGPMAGIEVIYKFLLKKKSNFVYIHISIIPYMKYLFIGIFILSIETEFTCINYFVFVPKTIIIHLPEILYKTCVMFLEI